MRHRGVRTIVAILGFLGVASGLALTVGDLHRWRRVSRLPRLSAPAPVGVGLEISVSNEEWCELIGKGRLESPRSVSELLHEWRLLASVGAVVPRPATKRAVRPT